MGIVEGEHHGIRKNTPSEDSARRINMGVLKKLLGVDTAQLFNQRNYGGKIKEVNLMGQPILYELLDRALEFVYEKKYYPRDIMIVNIVNGEPKLNEPTEAILLSNRRTNGAEGLLIKRYGPLTGYGPKKRLHYKLYLNSGDTKFTFIE